MAIKIHDIDVSYNSLICAMRERRNILDSLVRGTEEFVENQRLFVEALKATAKAAAKIGRSTEDIDESLGQEIDILDNAARELSSNRQELLMLEKCLEQLWED